MYLRSAQRAGDCEGFPTRPLLRALQSLAHLPDAGVLALLAVGCHGAVDALAEQGATLFVNFGGLLGGCRVDVADR